MSKHHVTTTINGEPTEYLCEGQQTMLDVLRDELGLTGTKEGCSSGDCGASLPAPRRAAAQAIAAPARSSSTAISSARA